MKTSRSAVLGGCLALSFALYAGTARAAQPENGRYVHVPAGATVVVLPGSEFAVLPGDTAMTQADFPVARLFARQEAVMNRMMADMDSLLAMPLPDPRQMIQSVMNGMPRAAPDSAVIMTSLTSGNGTCSETITYGYPANGGKPQVKVTRSGNACGAITASGPTVVFETPPTAPRSIPDVGPATHGPRLWTIGYPPHPVVAGMPRF